MEAILGFIGLIVLFGVGRWLLGLIFGAGAATVKAAAKTATGKGSFSENIQFEFKGMEPLEIRLQDERVGDNNETLVVHIEGQGLMPVHTTTNVGFSTSVFDVTDGDLLPVLTHVDTFQEEATIAYQAKMAVGEVESNVGFKSWVRLGIVIPEILQPPEGGKRKLKFVLRMVDIDNPPDIELGYGDSDLWSGDLDYEYYFEGKGYQEASEELNEARVLSIKIGIAIAMADGSLADSEGQVLQNWVKKMITPYDDERQSELKALYNDAMEETYQQAKDEDLTLSEITTRMNEIDNENAKIDALELAFQVMSADGVAQNEELETINKIAESMGVDYEDIKKLKDQNILKLDASVSTQESAEALLDIDPNWDAEQINRHLRSLFQTWNGRLNALPEGTERDQAQRMISLIGECQKKYARET